MIDIISFDGLHQIPTTSPSTQTRSIGDVSPALRTDILSTPGHSEARGTDTVEISNEALALSRAAGTSSLRMVRNNAIQAEINAGTYETPERIAKTVDRLLNILG